MRCRILSNGRHPMKDFIVLQSILWIYLVLARDRIHCAPGDSQAQQRPCFRLGYNGRVGKRHVPSSGSEVIHQRAAVSNR